MAGEKEVRAQVKLRFLNTAHERMVVTRNLSVSVKKSGLTMKTLETVLAKDEAGESNYKVRFSSSSSAFALAQEALRRLTRTPFSSLACPSAEYHLFKMLRDQRRSAQAPRCLSSDPRQRHLLPPGRVQLASVGAGKAEGQVRRDI